MSANDYLGQGIAAAKAGKKNTARRLLSEAVRADPKSEIAWLWLSSLLDTNQGRLYCLQQVLQINPTNRLAQKGIMALRQVEPAPVPVPEPEPTEPPKALAAAATLVEPIEPVEPTGPTTTEADVEQLPARDPATTLVEELRSSLVPADPPPPPSPSPAPVRTREQEIYWKIIVGGLAIIALCLVVLLAYVIMGRPTAARGAEMAMVIVTNTPSPRGTLRPTFTPSPTTTPANTPTLVPTLTTAPTHTPLPLPTDTPTPTLTPTLTPTPKPARRSPPTATPIPKPKPTLPPRSWDTRLNPMGIRIEGAGVSAGKPHWRLVDARWTNEHESEGRHSIYVEVQDDHGNRVIGQPVIVQWPGSAVNLTTEDRPAPEYAVNFPMYATLGGYAVSVGGAPSDKVTGLGLGTASSPAFTIHTCFYLTFRWVH